MCAAAAGHIDCVHVLLLSGAAGFTAEDYQNKTALDLAVDLNHEEIIRFPVNFLEYDFCFYQLY